MMKEIEFQGSELNTFLNNNRSKDTLWKDAVNYMENSAKPNRQAKLDQLKKWTEEKIAEHHRKTPPVYEVTKADEKRAGEIAEERERLIAEERERLIKEGADLPDEKLFNTVELRALQHFPSGGQKIIRDIKKAGLG